MKVFYQVFRDKNLFISENKPNNEVNIQNFPQKMSIKSNTWQSTAENYFSETGSTNIYK